MHVKKSTWWLLAAIMGISLFLRLFLINQMPGGLFPDEAANGLDINLMEQGQIQPFYERGNGREAMFFYMLWGSVKLFGRGPWQHHIVSALLGVLTVLFTFFLVRKLFLTAEQHWAERADLIALLSSFFVGVSSWQVIISRTAFRANTLPLFVVLFFWSMLETYLSKNQKRRLFWSGLTGLWFGLGFYTYIAFRVMLLIVPMVLLWPILAAIFEKRYDRLKTFILPLIVFCCVTLITLIPMASYMVRHPDQLVGRSGQVSVFNTDLNQGKLVATTASVVKQSVLGYFTEGDTNWRHNISGKPLISPILSPFLLIGALIITYFALVYFLGPRKYSRYWWAWFLIIWTGGMLAPVVTTAEGIPHALRSLGTVPGVFVLIAFGLVWVINFLFKTGEEGSHPVRFGTKIEHVILGILATVLIMETSLLYFGEAYASPAYQYAFRADLTVVSNYLLKNGSKEHTYLILDKFSVQTTDYLTTVNSKNPEDPRNQPYRQVDPENAYVITNLVPGDEIVFTQSSVFDTTKFKQYHSEAYLKFQQTNRFNQTVLAVYGIK